jgi:hypothetical protein
MIIVVGETTFEEELVRQCGTSTELICCQLLLYSKLPLFSTLQLLVHIRKKLVERLPRTCHQNFSMKFFLTVHILALFP